MRAIIYTGGKIYPQNITEHPKGDDLVIAADSGYQNALLLKKKVDLLVGDLDSLKEPDRVPGSVEVIRVPAEKDITDTHLAVQVALEKGADELVIVGGLGGRLDHTLSTLAILEDLYAKNVHAVITNGQNRVHFFRSTSYLIARSQYRYLSLIAADEEVKGVTIEGCKYPLKKATLSRRFQFAVSNEITGNCALISVRKGGVYLIESTDL